MPNRMPKNKSYVIHYGDKFGIVTRAYSFSRSVVVAEIWERNSGLYSGVHQIKDRTYSPSEWRNAVDAVDGYVHPNADGTGEWRDYTSPGQLAREFWPQDYTEPEAESPF